MSRFKELLKSSFAWAGVDVRDIKHTEDAILRRMLMELRPAVVIDVGANVGQYGRKVRRLRYSGRMVSYEPLVAAHAELSRLAESDPQWTVAPRSAVGREDGSLMIHVARDSVSSSLMPSTNFLTDAAPRVTPVDQQQTPIVSLDSPAAVATEGSVFLKVDTQGYELEVLGGATEVLKRVCGLQLELSLVPLYSGAPTIADVLGYVVSIGFEPFQLVPGFRDDRTGRLLQAEGFFVRAEQRL